VVRRNVYRDTHLFDTFFDAGGNHNFAVVACSVVSKNLWISMYMPVAAAVYVVSFSVVIEEEKKKRNISLRQQVLCVRVRPLCSALSWQDLVLNTIKLAYSSMAGFVNQLRRYGITVLVIRPTVTQNSLFLPYQWQPTAGEEMPFHFPCLRCLHLGGS